MTLEELGWSAACEGFFGGDASGDLFPARVSFASHGRWRLLGKEGEIAATLSGKARNDHNIPTPVVGDWVAARRADSVSAVILGVMPRQSALVRGEAGGRKKEEGEARGEQVLAANVSKSLIVCGLDRDYNPRRIERYIALSYGGGVQPVVLLNKADLCPDAPEKAAEVASLAPGVEVLALSALDGDCVERVRTLLHSGETVCLLGSSGAGKSTLLNGLASTMRQETRATSDVSGKGLHTTTHRELFVLPGGIIVIDTPGLREVALSSPDGLEQTFPEVEALAKNCRFRDCTHDGEPDCAVVAAVESGKLSGERWESFIRLRKEVRYRERVADLGKASEEKDRWKSISKAIKQFYKE
jgi:ribosome biogenesis GTPase